MELLKLVGYLLGGAALFVNLFWALKAATTPPQKRAIVLTSILQFLSLAIFIAASHRWSFLD